MTPSSDQPGTNCGKDVISVLHIWNTFTNFVFRMFSVSLVSVLCVLGVKEPLQDLTGKSLEIYCISVQAFTIDFSLHFHK